jgi:hypothetical protein
MSARLDSITSHLMLSQGTHLPSNTSTTQSNTNHLLSPIAKIYTVYTGTKDQPDVVSVFFKPSAGEIHIADEHIVNDLGHSPIEFMSALHRINNAAKILFQELKQGTLSEAWNALKNLSRGVIQLVPLLGNGVLYVHDLARLHLSIHPKIKSALSNQEEAVLGIAFDGKPIFTVPPSLLYPNEERTPAETLALVNYIWLGMITRTMKNNDNFTRAELAEQMHQMLLNRQFTGSTTTQR